MALCTPAIFPKEVLADAMKLKAILNDMERFDMSLNNTDGINQKTL